MHERQAGEYCAVRVCTAAGHRSRRSGKAQAVSAVQRLQLRLLLLLLLIGMVEKRFFDEGHRPWPTTRQLAAATCCLLVLLVASVHLDLWRAG